MPETSLSLSPIALVCEHTCGLCLLCIPNKCGMIQYWLHECEGEKVNTGSKGDVIREAHLTCQNYLVGDARKSNPQRSNVGWTMCLRTAVNSSLGFRRRETYLLLAAVYMLSSCIRRPTPFSSRRFLVCLMIATTKRQDESCPSSLIFLLLR